MTVHLTEYIRWGTIFLFSIFHISVAIFILIKINKQSKNNIVQRPTFFKLYLMVSISDILDVIVPFIGMRLILVDSLKPWFMANLWLNRINWLLSGFNFYNQCFFHTSIAINRAWKAFMIYKKSSNLSIFGAKFIWFIPLISFCILIPRFGEPAIYYTSSDGEIHPKYENPGAYKYTSTSATIIVLLTSSISLNLGIITIFRYRYLLRYTVVSQAILMDYRLFLQASFLFAIQLLYIVHYIIIHIATTQNLPSLQNFGLDFYMWVNDIFCLSNPIVLLAVSKTIRTDYFNFILRRKNKKNSSFKVVFAPQRFANRVAP